MGAVHLEVHVGNPNKKRAVKVISKQDLRNCGFDPQRELRFLGIASKVLLYHFVYRVQYIQIFGVIATTPILSALAMHSSKPNELNNSMTVSLLDSTDGLRRKTTIVC